MQQIAQFLEQRYPGDGNRNTFREALLRICDSFVASGLADAHFTSKLTSGSDSVFWSRLSEALIYDRLHDRQFGMRPTVGVGPDFLLRSGNRRVWIEVVCPEPAGIPAEWLEVQTDVATTVPHESILLRWTSAIKAKSEALLGSESGKVKGYLQTGVVSERDVYVIAVNGCQLRHGPFPALHGISQFPYAVEAVFPIGPYQLQIDRQTLKCVGRGHQERFTIPKPNGASVPAYTFLDPHHKPISAVWAVDFNGGAVVGNLEPSALIHNPDAINPLPRAFLPCDEEYIATPLWGERVLIRKGRIGEVTANPSVASPPTLGRVEESKMTNNFRTKL